MAVTLILSLVLMAALFALLWAAVALIQSKKFFSSAPKDIQEAVLEHDERFPGARILGWVIGVICLAAFVGAFIYAAWDGIQREYDIWAFFVRFLIMLYSLKAFDIIFFDWYLLTKSHFFQHYYPETEGCEGYHQ
ncbi:MAG: hypothetical protein ACI4KR_12835, partial [Ruminiclostridium sp.]